MEMFTLFDLSVIKAAGACNVPPIRANHSRRYNCAWQVGRLEEVRRSGTKMAGTPSEEPFFQDNTNNGSIKHFHIRNEIKDEY